MSDREKKLVFLFGFAAFVMVNFLAIKWFVGMRDATARKLKEAEARLQQAEVYAESFESVIEEMEWLADHYPEPKARQIVESELERYGSNLATTNQLELKPVKILPPDETGRFHRAKVQFAVSGAEANVYRWLGMLQDPNLLRANTFLRLSPKRDDDTKIDCTVTVEQWFVPATEES